jgi:hypothetical protein
MDPFFISIVSGFDHWMFLSTTGGITAGRKNSESALFPYYTEDKITDNSGTTGSLTHLIVSREGEEDYVWSPFDPLSDSLYSVERNLYKSIYGEKIYFEEINRDLGLVFRYGWMTGDRFGIIRESRLQLLPGARSCQVRICDGVRNILPYGTFPVLQNDLSCLLDAYKKTELDTGSGLGIFRLSSLLTDRAEPSEALRANTIFTLGIKPSAILLSTRQVRNFLTGEPVHTETDVRGFRGAYLVVREWDLSAGDTHTWFMAADLNKDHAKIIEMIREIGSGEISEQALRSDILSGTEQLKRFVALSDGIQITGNKINTIHHFANVMFNIMRGGIFASEYRIDTADFQSFITSRNTKVATGFASFLSSLPATLHRVDLAEKIKEKGNDDLRRLFLEYLPLSFSRRHGDPSRPWNQFSIILKDENGQPRLNYQGNWRDIFQNWEALAYSFPQYLDGMITRFLCATTADGYNPYRVTRDGFDWEEPEPHNPWANIGYWQDHQIIYLAKLLEVFHDHYPGEISKCLTDRVYTHANVPYRIKPYRDICNNYRDTILFDREENTRIHARVKELGTDGKVLFTPDGEILKVNMTEKVLALLLAKLVNYVPGGGIWMNTQRPEWNDANNALVGPGLSMVTLSYMRRFTLFLIKLMDESGTEEIPVSEEITTCFREVLKIYRDIPDNAHEENIPRKRLMDALGEAGSRYREKLYKNGLSGRMSPLAVSEITGLCRAFLKTGDRTLSLNRRKEGLFHSYNLLEWDSKGGAAIKYLYEMLEGQVAVLSSGYLNPEKVSELLDAMKRSPLYRKDQNSYILYPDRELPRFLEMNTLNRQEVDRIPLLARLLSDNRHEILYPDSLGKLHFNPDFRNGDVLARALDKLAADPLYGNLAKKDRNEVLDLYEKIFNHISFTGRSGTFFAYEGLGSIYWHMVSKLLLACQETEEAAVGPVKEKLKAQYRDIRSGIGYHKSPAVYGAFPTDPYSHTPAHTGARQPGMTGQVKEEVITRRHEMGVIIDKGLIAFHPEVLEVSEFLGEKESFSIPGIAGGEPQTLDPDSLLFTIYRIPVRYTKEKGPSIIVRLENGKSLTIKGNTLTAEISRAIFNGKPVAGEDSPVREIQVSAG